MWILKAGPSLGPNPVTGRGMELWLSIVCTNTHDRLVNMAQNNDLGIVCDEYEWYLLPWLNHVPNCLFEIQTTPPPRHWALISGLEPILVVPMPGVAEILKCAIHQVTYRTDFKLVNIHVVNATNITNQNLTTTNNEIEIWCNKHTASYESSSPIVKSSSNGQL